MEKGLLSSNLHHVIESACWSSNIKPIITVIVVIVSCCCICISGIKSTSWLLKIDPTIFESSLPLLNLSMSYVYVVVVVVVDVIVDINVVYVDVDVWSLLLLCDGCCWGIVLSWQDSRDQWGGMGRCQIAKMSHDKHHGLFLWHTGWASHSLGPPLCISLSYSSIEWAWAAHIPLERGKWGQHFQVNWGACIWAHIPQERGGVHCRQFHVVESEVGYIPFVIVWHAMWVEMLLVVGWGGRMGDILAGPPTPWVPPHVYPSLIPPLSCPHPCGKGRADAAGLAFPSKFRHLKLSPHPSREGRGSVQGSFV